VRCRAPHILPPRSLWPLKGPALLLLLRRAARARGSACKRRRGAFAPSDPLYCARDSLPPPRCHREAHS
jgi:hypothetical protein